MTPYFLEFRLEGLPETTNQILAMKLRQRLRQKSFWKRQVWLLTTGKKPKEPLKIAKVTLVRFSTTRPDPDGLVSSFKHILDGLVECNILENDKFENIGFPDYFWQKSPKNEGHCLVRIESISN